MGLDYSGFACLGLLVVTNTETCFFGRIAEGILTLTLLALQSLAFHLVSSHLRRLLLHRATSDVRDGIPTIHTGGGTILKAQSNGHEQSHHAIHGRAQASYSTQSCKHSLEIDTELLAYDEMFNLSSHASNGDHNDINVYSREPCRMSERFVLK